MFIISVIKTKYKSRVLLFIRVLYVYATRTICENNLYCIRFFKLRSAMNHLEFAVEFTFSNKFFFHIAVLCYRTWSIVFSKIKSLHNCFRAAIRSIQFNVLIEFDGFDRRLSLSLSVNTQLSIHVSCRKSRLNSLICLMTRIQ